MISKEPTTPWPQSLTKNLWERLELIHDEVSFPIRMSVDETEEVIRILWEFVGHMGDVTPGDGYQQHLLERARHWAQEMQTAMLAAIAYAGPKLIETVANGSAARLDKSLTENDLAG